MFKIFPEMPWHKHMWKLEISQESGSCQIQCLIYIKRYICQVLESCAISCFIYIHQLWFILYFLINYALAATIICHCHYFSCPDSLPMVKKIFVLQNSNLLVKVKYSVQSLQRMCQSFQVA